MACILMSTCGTHGDVFPFIAIGQRLQQRGHAVTIITHSVYEESVSRAGVEFAPIDSRAEHAHYIASTPQLLDQLHDPAGSEAFQREYMIPRIDREYAIIEARHRPGETVLVARHLTGASLGDAVLFAAEQLGLPLTWVALAPTMLSSMPLSAALADGQTTAEANERRHARGLPAIQSWFGWAGRVPRLLCLWPEWFADRDSTWPQGTHFCGFVLNDEAESGPVPDAVQRFLADGPPPVLITGGSGNMIHPSLYHVAIEACEILGLRALVVSPFQQRMPQLSSNIFVTPHLPFATVMPHVDCVIHHGGIGTIGRGMVSGVPQLILASGTDRPENARYAEQLGIGISLTPARWHPWTIAEELRTLRASAAIRLACKDISHRIQAHAAIDSACTLIEELVGQPYSWVRDATPMMSQQQNTPADNVLGKAPITSRVELSAERRALLALRLRQRAMGQVTHPDTEDATS